LPGCQWGLRSRARERSDNPLTYTKTFGENRWAIHYYAPIQGHELVTRRDPIPSEPDHPCARGLALCAPTRSTGAQAAAHRQRPLETGHLHRDQRRPLYGAKEVPFAAPSGQGPPSFLREAIGIEIDRLATTGQNFPLGNPFPVGTPGQTPHTHSLSPLWVRDDLPFDPIRDTDHPKSPGTRAICQSVRRWRPCKLVHWTISLAMGIQLQPVGRHTLLLQESHCHASMGGVLTMLTPLQFDINLTDMIYQPLLHIYFE
jgi:hypothetical protein